MGFEFSADVTGNGDYEAAIRRALARDELFEVLPSETASIVSLRIRASARRAEWPEDAQVHFRPKQIHVLFHWANGHERAHLVEVVERAIAEVGCEGTFVED
jgi:hypothetical protein